MKRVFTYFLLGVLAVFVSANAFAQRSPRPADKVHRLTDEEALERWNEFLNSQTAPYYTFAMELEHRPRRGESVYYDAMMFGKTRGNDFSIRLDISAREGGSSTTSFLIISESGKNKIYRSRGEKIEQLDESQWHVPLIEGLIYTPFDILMPYKHWPWKYYGAGRVGRALHFFDLLAPEGFASEISLVRVGLSREFNAPFQTEYFDSQKKLMRTMSLSSVKKFQENWITKQIEMQDAQLRDKDRLTIMRGSFTPLPPEIFDAKILNVSALTPALEDL